MEAPVCSTDVAGATSDSGKQVREAESSRLPILS